MIDNFVVLKTLIGLILSLFIFFIVGLVFNFLLNKRNIFWGWLPTYFYLLSGMLLSISFFAIYKTNFQTVLIVIPLFLGIFSFFFHKQFVFQEVNTWQKKIEPFVFLFASVSIYYLYYFQGFAIEGNSINYIYGDVEYYARVAQNISQLGVENMRVEYLYPQRFTVEPYHYGDLWTIALVCSLTPVLPVYATILIAAPVLLAIATLGAAAFIQHFFLKQKSNIVLLLILLLAFIGGFSIFFPKFLFPGSVDVYAHSLSNYTKLAWWASILPIIYVLLINKSDRLIPFIVFIIGFGYINVFPTLFMTSFLWVAYIGYKRGEFKRYFKTLIFLTIIGLAFLYVFYSIIPSLSQLNHKLSPKAAFSFEAIIKNYRTSINIFIGGGLQFLVYTPIVALLFVYHKVEGASFKKSLLVNVVMFSFLALFSALLVWAVLFTTTFESIQFFYNVFVVIAGLLSVVVGIYIIINSRKIVIKCAAMLLLILSAASNSTYTINVKSINKEEKEAVFNFVDSANPKTFAYYLPSKDYTTDVFASSTVVAIPLSFIGYKIAKYQNFSLNVPFAQLDTTKREYPFQLSSIAWAPMSYFVKQPENNSLSKNELMQKFMRQNKIGFLCLPINVTIPDSLNKLVVDSLYTSTIGWKIYKCVY